MYQIGPNQNAPLGGAYGQESFPAPSGQQPAFGRSWRGDGVAPGSAFGGFASSGTAGTAGAGGWASSATSSGSGLSGVLSSFYSAIQGLFSQLTSSINATGTGGAGTTSATPPCAGGSCTGGSGAEQGYTSATATSQGDPHLAFAGTSTGGTHQNGKWDNMNAHSDLLDSDSSAGGYTVSTTTTTPDANGVTYNKNATVTTDGGATAVTFGNDGTLSVTQNGNVISVQSGQSLALGNGETVTSNQDGSATVSQATASGGSIATTLKSNGPGVDVSTQAQNVDLGGYLVTGRDGAPPTSPSPYGNAPIGYEPIYAGSAQANVFDGFSPAWQSPQYVPSQTASSSPFTLAGYAEPSIEDELG